MNEQVTIAQSETACGPCLCNILWIQANSFKKYHAHKKPTWPWPLTMTLIFN